MGLRPCPRRAATSHAGPGSRPRDMGTGESAPLEHLQWQQASGHPREGQLPEHRPHLCPRGHSPLQESKSPVCVARVPPPRAREQPAFPLLQGAQVPAQSRVTHSAAGQAGYVAGLAQTCCPGTLRTPRHNVRPEAAAWVCTAASGSSGTRPPALCPCGPCLRPWRDPLSQRSQVHGHGRHPGPRSHTLAVAGGPTELGHEGCRRGGGAGGHLCGWP